MLFVQYDRKIRVKGENLGHTCKSVSNDNMQIRYSGGHFERGKTHTGLMLTGKDRNLILHTVNYLNPSLHIFKYVTGQVAYQTTNQLTNKPINRSTNELTN